MNESVTPLQHAKEAQADDYRTLNQEEIDPLEADMHHRAFQEELDSIKACCLRNQQTFQEEFRSLKADIQAHQVFLRGLDARSGHGNPKRRITRSMTKVLADAGEPLDTVLEHL